MLDNKRYVMHFPEIEKCPLTVIKSNGSYTYDTTDLAAIRYRLCDLKMTTLYYVVDNGQSTHFKKIFAAAKLAGWLTTQTVKHINFGLICKKGGGKYATRNGDTDKLIDLLNSAIDKSKIMFEKIQMEEEEKIKENIKSNSVKSELTDEEKTHVINSIGIGAVIYSDLSVTRTNDYVFDLDRMLLLKGNTSPHLLYSYVRTNSIIKKANQYLESSSNEITTFDISKEPIECKLLCAHLLHFDRIIEKLFDDLNFNNLCAYLYKVTELFNKFFSKCKCVTNDNVDLNRLLICHMVERTMLICFNILGMKTINKM